MVAPWMGSVRGGLVATLLTTVAICALPPSATAALEIEHVDEGIHRHHLVTTPQGETVLVWEKRVAESEGPFGYRQELWTAVKPADGPLGEPQLLSPDIADCTVRLEVDEDGNVALIYEDKAPEGAQLQTHLKRPGKSFQAPRAVPDPVANFGSAYQMDIADGDIAIGRLNVTTSGGHSSSRFFLTISEQGAEYGPLRLVAEGEPVHDTWHDEGGYDLHMAPDGEVTLAWARREYHDAWRLRSTYLTPGGSPAAAQTLAESPNPITCPRLDGDAAGNVAILWMQTGCKKDSLHLATRAPGLPFGAPTTIANSSWIEGPDLDVGEDGQITVGYSDDGGVNTLSGSFTEPIAKVGGPPGEFSDLAAPDASESVLASHKYATGITVGNVTAGGTVEPGPWIATGNPFARAGPVGENGVAVAFGDGAGLKLAWGTLEATPEPIPPLVPFDSEPSLEILDDGEPWHRLGRRLVRQVRCSLDCTLRGTLRLRVPGHAQRKRVLLAEGPTTAEALAPARLRVAIPESVRRRAKAALLDGRRVLAHLRIGATEVGGRDEVRTSAVIQLGLG